jgi:hypothetical protein
MAYQSHLAMQTAAAAWRSVMRAFFVVPRMMAGLQGRAAIHT